MNSFKNPLTPVIDAPINIDRPIQELQIWLGTLPWLEKSFGRSYDSYRMDVTNKKVTYPEVWQGQGKDLLQVMPNDNLNSQSFFKVEDPINVKEYNADSFSVMEANVSIIFWFNLKRIDPDLDYRYIEILRGQAQRKITTVQFTPDSSIEILKIWDSPQQVFKGYDIATSPQELFTQPYGGFRFDCRLSYIEDCPDS